MKALSIRQPWAWAILRAGKDIENRDWSPRNPGLRFRGRCVVHASAKADRSEFVGAVAWMVQDMGIPLSSIPAFDAAPRGALLGTVDVFNVVDDSPSLWFFGPVGLLLREPRPFQHPIPFKGALGFFDVPDGILPHA